MPIKSIQVKDYMSGSLVTFSPDTEDATMSIIDLAELFAASGYRRYPVMQDNMLVGQISRRDVLRALEALASG